MASVAAAGDSTLGGGSTVLEQAVTATTKAEDMARNASWDFMP